MMLIDTVQRQPIIVGLADNRYNRKVCWRIEVGWNSRQANILSASTSSFSENCRGDSVNRPPEIINWASHVLAPTDA